MWSEARQASAMMVSVGFLSALEHSVAPSVMNRFFMSQLWPKLLVTDFVGSLPIIAPPTSWMMMPPCLMALSPRLRLRSA